MSTTFASFASQSRARGEQVQELRRWLHFHTDEHHDLYTKTATVPAYIAALGVVAEAAKPFESEFEVFDACDGTRGIRMVSSAERERQRKALHDALIRAAETGRNT